jgi:ribosomal protein S27AE
MMIADGFGPTADDETIDRFRVCPACGSRATHRQSGDAWHCHKCGHYFWEEGTLYGDGPVDEDIVNEPCDWDEVELCD